MSERPEGAETVGIRRKREKRAILSQEGEEWVTGSGRGPGPG